MIDEELNQKFGGLIKNENLKQSCSKFIITKRSRFSFSNRRKSHDRKMTNHNWPIWARMACIIVFDQVPRNVYRSSKNSESIFHLIISPHTKLHIHSFPKP
mmetsp:Transcript_6163/g.7481  ORF Transcript_6163/g.7481 Transcript_6163/m.7481 type:complete len:101 (+) Transcript_6163:2-304(+)